MSCLSSEKENQKGGGREVFFFFFFFFIFEKMTLDCAYNEWPEKLYKNTAGIS